MSILIVVLRRFRCTGSLLGLEYNMILRRISDCFRKVTVLQARMA